MHAWFSLSVIILPEQPCCVLDVAARGPQSLNRVLPSETEVNKLLNMLRRETVRGTWLWCSWRLLRRSTNRRCGRFSGGRTRTRTRLSHYARFCPDFSAIRTRDCGLIELGFLEIFGDFVLSKEGHLDAFEAERIFLQVDLCAVAFEHVESKEQIDVLAFHDSEGAGHNSTANLNLGMVHTSQDSRRANTFGDSRIPSIDQSHDATLVSTARRHDGCLRTRVDKRLDGVPIDLKVDVEHVNTTERWHSVSMVSMAEHGAKGNTHPLDCARRRAANSPRRGPGE